MINNQWKFYSILLLLIDIFSIIASNMLSVWIRFDAKMFKRFFSDSQINANYNLVLFFIVPIFIAVYFSLKLYRLENNFDTYRSISKIFFANFLGTLILMSATFITKNGLYYSRLVIGMFVILNIVIDIVLRRICKYYLHSKYRKGYIQKRIALIGSGKLAEDYIDTIKKYYSWGYKLAGIITTEENTRGGMIYGINIIGSINQLVDLNEKYCFDEVIAALNFKDTYLLKKITKMCDSEGLRLKIIPSYYEFMKVSTHIEEMDGLPLLSVRGIKMDSLINRIIKRCFDISASALALIIFSPIMLIITIVIKITSPGPIIFKQERVGLNNNNFYMYKFRSMHVQTDSEEAEQWTTKDDSRKTRFGAFIRRTSLDELPQFYNVFIGNMSIVGPRPERPYWVKKFKEDIPQYMLRHYVKAGITGWAQVNGLRGDTSIEERIKFDNYYIQNWSFWFDVKIVFLTVFKGFVNKNAY